MPAKIKPPKQITAGIDGKSFEGCHECRCPGEVHRSLGMGGARKQERGQCRGKRAGGVDKVAFREAWYPLVGGPEFKLESFLH
jgi:hypothetical protein